MTPFAALFTEVVTCHFESEIFKPLKYNNIHFLCNKGY